MSCKKLDIPGLAPSWGCCQDNCRTMNGNQRMECKVCGHPRCDKPGKVVISILASEVPNGFPTSGSKEKN